MLMSWTFILLKTFNVSSDDEPIYWNIVMPNNVLIKMENPETKNTSKKDI